MHSQLGVDLGQNVERRLAHSVNARVAHAHRVHVDDRVHAGLLPDRPLGLVDQLVHGDNVRRVRYLGVQRCQRLAHTVIMYDQVVNAQNTRTLQHGIGNRLGDFRVGCLTDQRA